MDFVPPSEQHCRHAGTTTVHPCNNRLETSRPYALAETYNMMMSLEASTNEESTLTGDEDVGQAADDPSVVSDITTVYGR